MSTTKPAPVRELQPHFPSLEKIQQELGSAQSINDFFGKEGIFARLFSETIARGRAQTALPCESEHHEDMDDADSELGKYSQPISNSV